MLFHHLPQCFAHISSLGRYALSYGHAGSKALIGTLFQLQSPGDAFRVALRQSRFLTARADVAQGKLPLLIHYHIFKNAGTSFELALQHAFGQRFRQYDSPDPAGKISARKITRLVKAEPQLCAISSHQATPPPPRIVGRQLITSILIRDPIARIGSIYAFERAQQANSRGAVKAKELDFRSYVEWRLKTSPSVFCNYQVMVCSSRYREECDRRDLETAIIRLDAMNVVGTVARYGEWLALAQWHLQQYFPDLSLSLLHENRSNASQPRSEALILAELTEVLGPALTSELLSRNQLDMALHQVADSLLTRRLAEREIAIKLRETYTKAIEAVGKTPAAVQTHGLV
jgi:hypothetical protein